MKAKVTVIISNYNNGKYIEEAVRSVFEQTFDSWQVIIIDDTNGNDNVRDYLEYYLNTSSRIFLFKTDDIGLSSLRNFGASKSQGNYLLFMDADDKIHRDFLKKAVEVLDNNTEISIAYSDTRHFDGADTCWIQPEYHFYSLLSSNYICSCSLIRRSSFDAVGGFDKDNFNYWEDYEFWIALGAKGFYGKHIPEKLFYYRVHPESGMQSKRNSFLSDFYKSYIISKFPQLYDKTTYILARDIISKYPEGFISWKPKQQEKYLIEKGILNE